jgi:5'-3' exonuclease
VLKRLHVVDGTFELYRAHFAKRPGHVLPNGMDVKASVGVASSMLALLQDAAEAVTHVAVAFDNPITCFRNGLFDGYKTDEGVPDELRAQFDLVEASVAALGITVWSMRDFEADDGLATAAHRFGDAVEQVRILSPDKDLTQCVRGERVVTVDRIRNKVTGQDALRERRGLAPQQIPDFLALTGDTADGIPGLDGFGEKTAAALLQAFGSLEGIPLDVAAWPPAVRGAPRLCETLRQGLEAARLYKTLATLRTDAPITPTLEELEWKGVPRMAFETWCAEMNVRQMRPAVHRWAEG